MAYALTQTKSFEAMATAVTNENIKLFENYEVFEEEGVLFGEAFECYTFNTEDQPPLLDFEQEGVQVLLVYEPSSLGPSPKPNPSLAVI